MNPLTGLALFAVLVLSFTGSSFSLGPPEARARNCYSVWAEAHENGSHYRHLVFVENDCEYWLECSLWTNVDPQPPRMVSVGPGMTEQAETNGDSPYDDPKAFGACHRK